MDMGFCPGASSIVPMAYETEAFSGRPFLASVDSSVVDSLFVKDEAEEAFCQRTYMEMQPVILEPLRDERVLLTSTVAPCSSSEKPPRVSVDKACCTDLNVTALLQENAKNKELLKSLRSEVRELKEDQKFAQMRIDRLNWENSELKRELIVQKEVVKNVESSRENLLLCTEFFHLKFIQLQNSMEGITKLMSETKRFSLEDRKGDIFLSKAAALPSASNVLSLESSQAASGVGSHPGRTEKNAGNIQVIKVEASLPEEPPLSGTTYAPASARKKRTVKYKYKGGKKRRKRLRRTNNEGSKVVNDEIIMHPTVIRRGVNCQLFPIAISSKAVDDERVTPPTVTRKSVTCQLCPIAVSSKYALRRHQCVSHNIHSYQKNGMCVNFTRCGSTNDIVTSSTTELWMQ